jgi:hypothetical protein
METFSQKEDLKAPGGSAHTAFRITYMQMLYKE